jgi:AcrR family transcriptional regulator
MVPGRRRSLPLTKQRIGDVAIGLFAKQGVDRTTMRDVAQTLEVSEPAVYRYFASKDAMFSWTFLNAYARIAKGVTEAAADGVSLANVVRAIVAMFAGMFDTERNLFTFVLIDQHRRLPDIPDDPSVNVVSAIREVLRRAALAGRSRISDLDMAAAASIGIVVQTAIFTHYERLEGPLSARTEAMTRAVLAAVAALEGRGQVAVRRSRRSAPRAPC